MTKMIRVGAQDVSVPAPPLIFRPCRGLKYGALALVLLGALSTLGLVIAGHQIPQGNKFSHTVSYKDLGYFLAGAAAAGLVVAAISYATSQSKGDSAKEKKKAYIQIIEAHNTRYVAKHIFTRWGHELVSVVEPDDEWKVYKTCNQWHLNGHDKDKITENEIYQELVLSIRAS
jgi:hypothetical protein